MICIVCNGETNNPKFCSRSCSATFNNKKYPKRILASKNCLWCNAKIAGYRTYCNQECYGKFKFDRETIPRIERGEVTQHITLKKYLSELFGYICVKCNNTGIHNGDSLVLQLDHIDGNSDHNLPSNLRLLCPNCHSQTPTFTTRQKKDTKRNRYLQKFKGH